MVSPRDNPRALAVRDAFAGQTKGRVVTRGPLRLIFDELPSLVRNQAGEAVGVSVMVRLFDGLTEIRIDPHRVILNPPTVPRANLTYEVGALDAENRFVGSGRIVAQKTATKGVAYRRIVGAPDPEAALIEAVWDSIDRVPNAKGFGTRGTVTTVYATAPGGAGFARSSDAAYATARTGAALTTGTPHRVGQFLFTDNIYYIYEGFIIFDTSVIGAGQAVSAVVASLDGSSDASTTDFIAGLAASVYNGGQVVTGDWVSGAAIPTPELATWNSSGYVAGYNAFTETADFKTAINKTGSTSLILYSQRHRDATTPPDNENVVFTDADAAGTTTDPKLDITHAAGGGTQTISPSPVALPVVVPAPTVTKALTISPTPVALPLAVPAPILTHSLTLSPTPVLLPLAVPIPAVTHGLTLSPTPATIPVVVPAPVVTVAGGTTTITPTPVTVPVLVPAPILSLSLTISPSPVTVPLVVPVPMISHALTISPTPVTLPVLVPAPTVSVASTQTITPLPITIPVVVPAPTVSVAAGPAVSVVQVGGGGGGRRAWRPWPYEWTAMDRLRALLDLLRRRKRQQQELEEEEEEEEPSTPPPALPVSPGEIRALVQEVQELLALARGKPALPEQADEELWLLGIREGGDEEMLLLGGDWTV